MKLNEHVYLYLLFVCLSLTITLNFNISKVAYRLFSNREGLGTGL